MRMAGFFNKALAIAILEKRENISPAQSCNCYMVSGNTAIYLYAKELNMVLNMEAKYFLL